MGRGILDLSKESVRGGFQDFYGFDADGIWSAPGRVNLIGEHTDYNGGFVFPVAIDRRTFVAAAIREDGIVRVKSDFAADLVEINLRDIRPENLEGWSAYPLGVIWALGEFGTKVGVLPGLDIYIESNVPVGSGLSSSAAIECAVAVAVNDLWGLGIDRQELAQAGQKAENEAVGAPTGIMDQTASLFGEEGNGVFLDCRSLETTLIPLGLEEAGLKILVIDSKENHAHASGGYRSRRAACERAAATMGVETLRELGLDDLANMEKMLDREAFMRARHVITENVRVLEALDLMNQGRVLEIGPLLSASHASMRDDFEISTDALNAATEAAVEGGAIGARLTGGGFGGSAIALVPEARLEEVERRILNVFEQDAFERPNFFVVEPSRAAGLEVNLKLNRDFVR